MEIYACDLKFHACTALRTLALLCILCSAKGEPPSGQAPAPEPGIPVPQPEAPPPLPGEFDPTQLKELDDLPPRVLAVIARASELSKMRLRYKYGSDEPASGGMDCSGAIACVLRGAGIPDVPRQSDAIYQWVWQGSHVYPVVGKSGSSFELEKLRPGDLLFWTGTYEIEREVPITHVMLYLGTRRADGRRMMFGASDGRTFEGRSCFGVGMFDFIEPRPQSRDSGNARFIGYGPIPGL